MIFIIHIGCDNLGKMRSEAEGEREIRERRERGRVHFPDEDTKVLERSRLQACAKLKDKLSFSTAIWDAAECHSAPASWGVRPCDVKWGHLGGPSSQLFAPTFSTDQTLAPSNGCKVPAAQGVTQRQNSQENCNLTCSS